MRKWRIESMLQADRLTVKKIVSVLEITLHWGISCPH